MRLNHACYTPARYNQPRYGYYGPYDGSGPYYRGAPAELGGTVRPKVAVRAATRRVSARSRPSGSPTVSQA